MAQAKGGPELWRPVSMGVAVLGVVLVAANFLTWFSREIVFTNPDEVFVRTAAGFEGRLGYLEVAYGLVAVMIGLLCFAKPPSDPAVGRAVGFLVVVPLVGLACAVADWVAVAGDSGTTSPGVGLLLSLVCLLALLACGVFLRRTVAAASRVPG